MYGLSELKEALSNPHLVLRELNRAYHRRLYTRPYNTDGIDIFEADWDNLIILDACRYDTFCEVTDFEGVESRISRGAATPEFVRGNFAGKDLHDVVYATTNSWYFRLNEEIDTEVHAALYGDQSDPPELTETALGALDEYPNKRLLIHFIPPHHPFKGPTADRVFPSYEEQSDALFERIQQGELDIDDETLRQAYVENLEWVLPEVHRLLDELDGKTVVTADHGELLGDRTAPVPIADYGHHVGLYDEHLVRVPWYESTNGTRRRIVPEPPVSDEAEVGQEKVDQRLRELGYKV
ncbi:hypothetical protein [Haloarcula marina]|uniref:hypothetical protein n=1 Tax=Haloarcula marina TaxID=2961574 RepID=UPI0020B698D5|nr:hypothetical protein [Halomicroarcula marina]